MFVLRTTLKPKMGAGPEMRSLLIEWAKYRKSQGDHTVLSEDVWGPNGAVFHLVTLHESLAEAEQVRSRVTSDVQFKELVSKLGKLMSGPASWEVLEVLERAPDARPTNYALRAVLRGSPSSTGELRGVLRDWVKYRQGKGVALGLAEEVWGATGVQFSVRQSCASIADAAEERERARKDPKWPELVSKLGTVLERPVSWELVEVLVPAE